ncbi:MAG TPA: ABC transporter permease, partial [Bryobacteraceae bacterium]
MTDARYALRSLRRTPGFTAVAVLTLALGIGANTAIFSLVRAVILKPLPFRDPARLIAVWDTYLPQYDKLGASVPEIAAWQQQTDLFEDSAWYRYVPFNFTLTAPGADALEIHAAFASPRLLPLLGVEPAIGRAFTPVEPPNSVLLSDRLWQSRFSGDRAVVGRSIQLNGAPYTVLGILPAELKLPDWADVWLPPGPLLGDELTNPVRHSRAWIARLRPGVTRDAAEARIRQVDARLAAENPKTSRGFGVRALGLQEDLTAGLRAPLLLLWGAVALVLLIACANVANLLLSRAGARTREIAVRTAIGAGALRLARQFVTESLILSALGGALGLALAAAALRAFSPEPAPVDLAVLLFLFAVTLATGVLFGLAPVLQSAAVSPALAMKSGALPGGAASRFRGTLAVVEFAIALMLVIGAGLLARSFLHLMHVDPGFDPHGVLTLRLSVPPARDAAALFRRIEQRLHALPGVTAVAAANTLPIVADRATALRFYIPGSPLINPDALPAAQLRLVTPED